MENKSYRPESANNVRPFREGSQTAQNYSSRFGADPDALKQRPDSSAAIYPSESSNFDGQQGVGSNFSTKVGSIPSSFSPVNSELGRNFSHSYRTSPSNSGFNEKEASGMSQDSLQGKQNSKGLSYMGDNAKFVN